MSEVNKFGFKVGDRFEAKETNSGSQMFLAGSIVELINDDGSDCPEFKLISGECLSFKMSDSYDRFEEYLHLKKIDQ